MRCLNGADVTLPLPVRPTEKSVQSGKASTSRSELTYTDALSRFDLKGDLMQDTRSILWRVRYHSA